MRAYFCSFNTVEKLTNQCKLLTLIFFVFFLSSNQFANAQITVPAGSYVIDMGINSAVKPAGLRPYGMIHELVKYYRLPVLWVIREGKAKDAVDYTIGGVSYKGGLFIIPGQFVTSQVTTAINAWTAGTSAVGPNGYTRGLVVARMLNSNYTFTGAKYDTIKTVPTWTLDAQNGAIAQGFLINAGIPSSAYNWLAPSQLGACSDIFVMPHADPAWATHGNLFNWNLQYNGAIWLACHAGSALENMYNPANPSQQTNFLSKKATTAGSGITLPVAGSTAYAQNSLVLWGNHSAASVPYITNDNIPAPQTGTAVSPDDWVSQFIGVTNTAHINGSEQVYLPVLGQGWRSTTKIITFDAQQADVPANSPGTAVIMAYGRGLGDPNRGQVMLSAGHSINKGSVGDVPAQCAFFNWSYYAIKDKAVNVGAINGVPTSGDIYVPTTFSVQAYSPVAAGNLTYSWSCIKKSDGSPVGTFTPNNTSGSATTSFDPGSPISVTDVIISVSVIDPCGRTTTTNVPGRVMPAPASPIALNDNAQINSTCYTPGLSTTINVLANDSDPDGNLNNNSVVLINPSNSAQTGNSYTVSGIGTWTTNGTTVTFAPANNFFGTANINYKVCDNTPSDPLCSTATIFVGVGSPDVHGCFPGSIYDIVTETGADTAYQDVATVSNPNSASGTADFDPADIASTAATISTNTTAVLKLDYSSIVNGKDSITIYFAPSSNNTTTIAAEYSTDNTNWNSLTLTDGSETSSNVSNDLGTAVYDFPVGGLRYIRITKTGTASALIDAVVLEDWDCVSSAVTAIDDNAFSQEDNPVIISVLDNDINPGDLNLTVSITQAPIHGKLSINPDNTITYINTTDYSGADSFDYQICNSTGSCSSATVNVTVQDDGCPSGQYAPISNTTSTATFSSNTEAEDAMLRQDQATNNFGASNTIDIGKKPNKSKRYIWKPLGFTSAIPANAIIDTAYFRITQTGGDRAPFTLNTSLYRLTQSWVENQTTWNISATSNNWTSSGGSYNTTAISNVKIARGANGTQSNFNVKSLVEYWQSNRSVTSPRPDEMGLIIKQTTETSLDKRVTIGTSENGTSSNRPQLTIIYRTIGSCSTIVNRAPLANPDVATATTSNAVNITNALNNDADIDLGTLSVTSAIRVTPSKGTLSLNGNTIIYTPNNSVSIPRVDTLLYTLSDGSLTDQAYIFVTVNNAAPFVTTDNSTQNSGVNHVVNVDNNDNDPENGILTDPSVTIEPKNGSYSISGTTITYTPNAGYYGNDTLIYERCELNTVGCSPKGLCDTAMVIFKVKNQPPTAANINLNTYSCQGVGFDLVNSIADPEGENLTTSIISGTTVGNVTTLTFGSLTLNADGTYTFVPSNSTGTQTIDYVVTDPGGLKDTGTITINVLPFSTNTPPVAVDDRFDTTTLDGVGPINQDLYVDVKPNDSDPDGNFINIQLTQYPSGPALLQPQHGTISILNGLIKYRPSLNFTGIDSFEYVLYDSVPPVQNGCQIPVRKYDIGLVTVRIDPLSPEAPIYITGTIWNDRNGSANGTFNNIPTFGEVGTNVNNTLYVYLINASGQVIDKTPVNSNGTYTLGGVPSVATGLQLVLSTTLASVDDSLAPIQTLPIGWDSTSPTITAPFNTNGIYITDKDWGIQRPPVANNVSGNYSNPGGTNTISVPTLNGNDPEDGVINNGGTIIINTLPNNGTLYYNGIAINPGDTIHNYNPALLTIDPADTATTISFNYQVVDAAGTASSPATVTLTSLLQISGTVWNDSNGSANGSFSGIFSNGETGTNVNNTLFVYLIDVNGNVIDTARVNANGTYNLYGAPVSSTGLHLILSTTVATIGSSAPSQTLPTGWTSTSPTSTTSFNTNGVSIINKDWGLQRPPVANNVVGTFTNPGGNNTIPVPTLNGNDPEDGVINSGGTLIITTLPSTGTLYYNGIAVQAGDTINNYNPALLTVDPNDNISSIVFTYQVIDAAGTASTSATVTLTTTLALSWLSFDAKLQQNNSTLLIWKTTNEINVLDYVVERSTDGTQWYALGNINSKGTFTSIDEYSFVDQKPNQGINYYRIKQRDNDLRFSYSIIRSVQLINQFAKITVSPNPTPNILQITIDGIAGNSYEIELMNALSKKMEMKITNSKVTMLDLSKYSTGVYLVKVRDIRSGKIQSFKVIKNQ